jgi:predicted DNA-binding transcriptional regulator AlpA
VNTYEFTLKFSLPVSESDMDELVERLGEAGCDDALIGIGQPGRIALEFAREAESAFDAISSAVANIKGAVPDAKLIEAAPDLVGLTDVADIVGCSRQNIRKIMVSSGGTFPPPVHEGKSALWHLSSVLVWLKDSKSYQVADDLLEVASINMQFNIAKEMVAIDPVQRTEILSLVG